MCFICKFHCIMLYYRMDKQNSIESADIRKVRYSSWFPFETAHTFISALVFSYLRVGQVECRFRVSRQFARRSAIRKSLRSFRGALLRPKALLKLLRVDCVITYQHASRRFATRFSYAWKVEVFSGAGKIKTFFLYMESCRSSLIIIIV